MKNRLPLIAIVAALLAACGRQDQPQRSEDSSSPPATPTTTSAPTPPAGTPSPGNSAPTAGGTASVKLAATQGHAANGMLSVTALADGVRLTGNLEGLPPNAEFGFHIHEKGDCSAPDASSAGEHFNPSSAQHGNPSGDVHHDGDMLNVKSNGQGMAEVSAEARGVTLHGSQATDVLGRAVVLHAKPDDYSSQPAGNSGARIACGVIVNQGPTS
jgi:Cu-Zn family superoxide dismutase